MPLVIHVVRKFVPAEWGGIETYLLGLLPELQRLGWSSEVHAPAESGTDGAPLLAAGIGFKTFRARYPYWRMGNEERARLVALGGNLVTLDEPARLLVDRRPALFHAHTQGRLGGVVRVVSRLRRMPYAVTIHGPLRAGRDSAMEAHAARTRGLVDLGAPFGLLVGSRRVANDADLLFVINHAEHEAWRDDRAGCHLEHVPHGVGLARSTEDARVAARRSIANLGESRFALVLGRLEPMKGQDIALAAFRQALPSDWHLVLAGPPGSVPFARTLETQAGTLNGRVHIAGGVPPSTARALLAEADLVLVPSRWEPFGIVLLEAWAEGAAVLHSDVGGLAYIARRSCADFGRVPQPTEGAWIDKIRAVTSNPCAMHAERRAAPGRVASHYSWRAAAERVAASYEHAVSASRPWWKSLRSASCGGRQR